MSYFTTPGPVPVPGAYPVRTPYRAGHGYEPGASEPAGPDAPSPGWKPQAPPDYRSWALTAIIAGIVCCLPVGMPLGLLAWRHSRNVPSRHAEGDAPGALRESRYAMRFASVAVAFDVLGMLFFVWMLSRAGHPAVAR